MDAVEERLRKYARPVKPEEMNRMTGTEDRGRRTRSSKIFSLGRGLYQAVMYPEAVHFKNKATGELQEIDNTLIPVTDTAGDTYLTNRCNDELTVEFHNAQAAAMILMQTDDGRLLSWKLENAQDIQPKIINDVKPRHAEDDRRRAVLDNLEGEVVYENIIPGVDMNCSVQALRFKDFFTFKELGSVQPVSFLVSMPDMVPEKMADGSIQIIAPTGEVAFTLPKPFLKDASVEASYGAVAVSMEPAGDPFTWRITFTPDMEWMQTAQFPVILDPAVITKNHSSAIEDNFVSSAYPSSVQSYSATGMTVSYSSSYDGIYKAQKKVVLQLAQNPCIIVGRCADHILREEGKNVFCVYLYASVKDRLDHVAELAENGTMSIEKYIEKRDKLRKTYYKQYTGHEMGNANNYNICFDTGRINAETCADIIIDILSREQ